MHKSWLFMCLLGEKAIGYSSKLSLLWRFVGLLLSDVTFMPFFFLLMCLVLFA